MTDKEPLIRVNNLSFSRGQRRIFNQISLDIPKGKITAIMGPSGTGKTTLLKLIGADLMPDKGHVYWKDRDIHAMSRSQLMSTRKNIGLLFQTGALFTDMSVYENVAFALREHTDLNEPLIRDVVLMKLEAVGLRGAIDMMPAELSGGMARRVALARTVALDPELVMYDEPFTGQDPISMGVLVRLIKELNKLMSITSVIVSHDVQETLSIADHVYILANGCVVGQGTPESLLKSQDPYVSQFIQGQADGVVPFHFPGNSYEEDLLEHA